LKKTLSEIVNNIQAILLAKAKAFFVKERLNYAKYHTKVSPRVFEYAFIISNVPKKARVLDVGCSAKLNLLPSVLAELGCEVVGVDVKPMKTRNENFHFVLADARRLPFRNVFDVCCAVSSLEHVGVPSTLNALLSRIEDSDGDVKTVKQMRWAMKRDGTMLLTVPFGKADFLPHISSRIYDANTIKKLSVLCGLPILTQKFVLEKRGKWRGTTRNEASKANHATGDAAVGMFKLSDPVNE